MLLFTGGWQEETSLQSKYSLHLEIFWSLLHLSLLHLTSPQELVGAGEDPVPMMCPGRYGLWGSGSSSELC